jgi:hypothetical protein
MQEKFPDKDPRQLRLVVEAPDDLTMRDRLAEAGHRLAAAAARLGPAPLARAGVGVIGD